METRPVKKPTVRQLTAAAKRIAEQFGFDVEVVTAKTGNASSGVMVSFTKSTLLVTDAICGTVDEIEQLAACFDVLHDEQAPLSMGDAEALPCLLTHPTCTIAPTIASFEAALTLLTNPAGFDGQMLIPDGVGGYCRLARGDAQRLLSDIETPFVIVVGPKRRFALVALRSAVELDVEDTLLYLVEDGLVLGVKSPTEWWIPDALPEHFG